MNIKTIIASILIAVGIIIIAYSGIAFTTPGETIDFIGIKIQTTDNHFIPPVVGAIALMAGVILLLLNPRNWTQGSS